MFHRLHQIFRKIQLEQNFYSNFEQFLQVTINKSLESFEFYAKTFKHHHYDCDVAVLLPLFIF